jgi:3-hydroxyacyl-[acyl-carrier-protein] dehydratase
MELDVKAIEAIIPHRWPFLLIDRIIELEPSRAVGIKQVSAGEIYFQGHFPQAPIMPGVLIVEAMAQVGAVALLSRGEYRGKLVLFAGIDGVRFRKPVTPGDTLRLEVELTSLRGPVGRGAGKALVDGQLVAEGGLLFAVSNADALKR